MSNMTIFIKEMLFKDVEERIDQIFSSSQFVTDDQAVRELKRAVARIELMLDQFIIERN